MKDKVTKKASDPDSSPNELRFFSGLLLLYFVFSEFEKRVSKLERVNETDNR